MAIQTQLRNSTHMTPIERSQGRFMRAPDHPTGEGAQNNQGEITPPAATEQNQGDNTGKPFDAEAFWSEAGGDDGERPSGESVQNPPTPSATVPPANPANELATRIQGMNFGAVMTPEIMAKLGDGDPIAFNEGIQQFGQQIMRGAIVESVGIMRQLREQIFGEVRTMIDGRATGDKQYEALTTAIPSAADPKMGPTVKNIYTRALERAKGNTTQAIQMTKDVLKIQAETFGADLDLTVAPRSESDNIRQPKPTNWLEELSAR
jgi:hypothetical protein